MNYDYPRYYDYEAEQYYAQNPHMLKNYRPKRNPDSLSSAVRRGYIHIDILIDGFRVNSNETINEMRAVFNRARIKFDITGESDLKDLAQATFFYVYKKNNLKMDFTRINKLCKEDRHAVIDVISLIENPNNTKNRLLKSLKLVEKSEREFMQGYG